MESNQLIFPPGFIWGTSTAAAQIETAYNHDWQGVVAKDGYVFERTSDHELHREEDLGYIASLGQAYRMSLPWWRLQTEPMARFDKQVVAEYRSFLAKLAARKIYIMMVLHHFTNPLWFVRAGSWEEKKTLPMFLDYVQQMVENFGDLVHNWNTFNEPAVYLFNSRLHGGFPPFKKSLTAFYKALKNMSRAHRLSVAIIKDRYENIPVGISKNAVIFSPQNFLGRLPAWIADKVFMEYVADHFIEGCDYWGMSYYAKIRLDPFPISEVDTPGKLDKMGIVHDGMWEYYPQGMKESVLRYHKRYGKPMFITESGICTHDSDIRIASIKDYLTLLHQCIGEGVDLRGYFHWSTIDNFEWNLGPTYKFGLVNVDYETGTRTLKKCGEFYKTVVRNNGLISN
ncbi:MAG: glycoside hydrolase family 1 protein [Sphingobacteriales bacterium]|nr:MAG: glycoside hydrolase family 1 protein [Sphingobacteriales bacterium]